MFNLSCEKLLLHYCTVNRKKRQVVQKYRTHYVHQITLQKKIFWYDKRK